MPTKRIIILVALLVTPFAFAPNGFAHLYFPHVASDGTWETEICIINTSATENLSGELDAYDNDGNEIFTTTLSALGPHARREITIGSQYGTTNDIGYMVLKTGSTHAVGYTKFYTDGLYRVAVPAVTSASTGNLFLPHIASTDEWWTGVSLVNVTDAAVSLTLDFDNGATRTQILAPGRHLSFTIKSLFDGVPQTGIGSAVIRNAAGVVGLELFGGGRRLSGIPLQNDTTTRIYYPHVAEDSEWWTGVVAYNPGSASCTLTVVPYTSGGTQLSTRSLTLGAGGKYVGTVSDLALPSGTEWFRIDATNGISGFELFGTRNEEELAEYASVGTSGTSGVFAKIEDKGWTGIAFVNTVNTATSVRLTAYDDSGAAIAASTVSLGGYAKTVKLVPSLFSGDIGTATYITYSSSAEIVGFQLNGSTDGTMLDGLPALPGSADDNGTVTEGTLVINEVVAKDANGGSDWIELYVYGGGPVYLGDYTLIDDHVDVDPSALPGVTLNPGEYLVLQATDVAPTDGSYYVPFKLGADDILILRKGSTVVDTLDWADGEAPEGYSYGRLPNGTGAAQTLTSTPGAANAAASGDTGNSSGDGSGVTTITLNGTGIAVSGTGVTVNGTTVTITAGGSYTVSGTLSDGRLIVDSADTTTVTLTLAGVNIHSSTNAPLAVMNAEKTVIVLADGAVNSLSDAASYVFENATDDEPNAALYSKDDLTIRGNGSLTVNGKYNDGIAGKDDLTIAGGLITVTAVDDGIRGKDSLVVRGGTLTVNAGGDGLKSDNEEDATKGLVTIEGGVLRITSGGDAIQAVTGVTISGGEFTLATGGGSSAALAADASAKGIKATNAIWIGGGTFSIDSADDAIHANATIAIQGGTFSISSGDDGIHADTSIAIDGGSIAIAKCYEGIESATITITGGDIHLTASDDGLNVAGGNDGSAIGGRPGQNNFNPSSSQYLYIYGGYIVIDARGDGLDANGSIVMTGGKVIISGPTDNGNGAIDYDGTFQISGGFLLALGSSGMAMAPSTSSTQRFLSLASNTALSAGVLLHIETSDGEEILTFSPMRTYQSIVLSSPDLVVGATYNVYVGGSSTGTVVDGLYQDGVYTPGTRYGSVTLSSTTTGSTTPPGRG